MAYAIYKAGVPAVVGTKTFVTGQVASPVTATSVTTGVGTVSPVTGTAVKHGQNSDNGTIVSVAKAKNTPQS